MLHVNLLCPLRGNQAATVQCPSINVQAGCWSSPPLACPFAVNMPVMGAMQEAKPGPPCSMPHMSPLRHVDRHMPIFGITVDQFFDISHMHSLMLFIFCIVTIYNKSLMHISLNSLYVKTG